MKHMLSSAECVNAICPPEKRHVRLTDSSGLFLEVTPNGSKRWFWRYVIDGRVRALPLGSYCKPGSKTVLVSLKEARAARDEARKEQQSGVDPIQRRKVAKLAQTTNRATTFEAVAREFHTTKAPGWSATHARQWMRCMEKDMLPWLGSLPLTEVSAPLLLHTLQRVEQRGATQMAHDLREWAGQVFKHAMADERCFRNPAAAVIGQLTPHTVKHAAAILVPGEVGGLMRAIDNFSGQPSTRAALGLSALTFQRPGNIRAMEWSEVDLDGAMWTIPAAKMKRRLKDKVNGRPHSVPLAPQAVAVLRDLQRLTGHGKYVFPSLLTGERCMSENTIGSALRRMGYSKDEMTAHGFRAMARTIMAEKFHDVSGEVVEAQLAHAKAGSLAGTYERGEFMDRRRQMMTRWADYLDKLRIGAAVIPIRAA